MQEAWKKRLNVDAYGIILSHISSLIPRKAHVVSLEITAECKKQGERPLLVIIGDPLVGEYYESLMKKVDDLGLREHVHFTGWTSDVPEILSLSHFTVLPSENEALGVVLMEGWRRNPIVAREGEGGRN
jgi:glycosyltransferase EpsD